MISSELAWKFKAVKPHLPFPRLRMEWIPLHRKYFILDSNSIQFQKMLKLLMFEDFDWKVYLLSVFLKESKADQSHLESNLTKMLW